MLTVPGAGSAARAGEEEEPVASRSASLKPTLRFDVKPESATARARLQEHWRPKDKDEKARLLIQQGLLQAQACQHLTAPDVQPIVEAMEYYVFEPRSVVEAGSAEEASGYYFIVEEGCLEVSGLGGATSTLSPGQALGGDGLVWGSAAVGTVVAKTRTALWGTTGPTFRRLLNQRVEEYAAENRKILASMASFAGLPAQQLDFLSHTLLEEVVEAGTVVVTKGDTTTSLYLVRKGSLRVVDGGAAEAKRLPGATELARLGPGYCFGERALLYGEPRTATVVALERCVLLRIRAEQLREALGTDLQAYLERCLMLSAMRDSREYSQFSAAQQAAIIQALAMQDCPAGAPIRSVVKEDFRLLIVVGGELLRGDRTVLQSGRRLEVSFEGLTSHRGDGQEALQGLTAGPAGARLGILTTEHLARALAPSSDVASAEQADETAKKMLLVKKVPLFRHLSQDHTERVVQALRLQRYSKGQLVIKQGDVGDTLFAIAHGEVTVSIEGRVIRTQGRNACFGERALLFDERRTATVEVTSADAELWTIDKATFGQIVKGMMREELMHRIALQDTKVTLEDLKPIKVIGVGAFSTVRMAEHARTKVRYALKTVKKQNGQAPPEMQNECSILLENDHPFILYVVKTFETPTRVCMLTELLTGGDLHAAIRMIPTVLSRQQSQFYTGTLVVAVEALWDRNIAYRDLKPENVMLDAQGYLKLIDFGISKKLADNQTRTFTMVGTPHYMAPEVMRGRGYGLIVDLWSLGVMLYEFVCGCLPFADELDNPTQVCTAVLKDALGFPRGFRDKEARDLIKALLCRQPEKRLGAGGVAQVKAMPYFQVEGAKSPEALFDRLMGRELQPPLLPRGERYCNPEDTQGCTLSDTEELWPHGAEG